MHKFSLEGADENDSPKAVEKSTNFSSLGLEAINVNKRFFKLHDYFLLLYNTGKGGDQSLQLAK